MRYTVYRSSKVGCGGMEAVDHYSMLDDAKLRAQYFREQGRRAAIVRLDAAALFPDPAPTDPGVEIVEKG